MFTTAKKAQGVSHWLNHRSPCEDAAVTARWGPVSVSVVCDGASCCRFGAETAELLSGMAARQVLVSMKNMMRMSEEDIRILILGCIRSAQRRVMQRHDCGIEDCGCTLSLAAANSESRAYLALQLGDGIVIGRREGSGELRQLTRPDKGQSDHATWLTVHPDDVIMSHLQVVRGHGMDAFFCTTDGLENVFYGRGLVAPQVGDLLKAMSTGEDAGQTLIEAIAHSPYQPDDDVSFAAMVMQERTRRARHPGRKHRGKPYFRCGVRSSERPQVSRAVQVDAGMYAR